MRDVPLGVDVADLELGGWDRATAEATFDRFEMKTVWQRMVELLDTGALGAPAPGSAGPEAPGVAAVAAAPVQTEAHPAAPALELRDVALPTSASEVTTRLTELGSRPRGHGGAMERHAGP